MYIYEGSFGVLENDELRLLEDDGGGDEEGIEEVARVSGNFTRHEMEMELMISSLPV